MRWTGCQMTILKTLLVLTVLQLGYTIIYVVYEYTKVTTVYEEGYNFDRALPVKFNNK